MRSFTFWLYGDFLATKLFSVKATSETAAVNAFDHLSLAELNAVRWTLDALTMHEVEVDDSLSLDLDEYEEAISALQNTEPGEL
ncbi:hypothetical protein [Lysobacter enzymogenes]|uniref:hypothetical protein n=1 Tax=Lysobacter enzymogenes TaxID=69 RepID=UPI001A96B367|nr:hypothetical protein [Lysobacter enzymogenes]QQP97963.1 hypothetical protein JHW38_08155 [Lysobacter enzymogenes]